MHVKLGMFSWLLLLLQWTLGGAGASLVKVNRGLQVKRGQTAVLQEDDLQFHIPRQRDACKLEVVLNEPITQRVGTLTPQVFDCHFLADEVKYVHNGCPILKQDTILLRLYRFTESETHTELFSLRVEILEPDCSIIKLGPKRLEVAEFYGLSDVLDGNAVTFNYERRANLECHVRITTPESRLPAHGQLVTGQPRAVEARGDEPHSFIPLRQQLDNEERARCKSEECLKGLKLVQITRVPCDDFLRMGIRYQHIDPPTPDVDYIAIRLDLVDTRSRSIYKSEQAWIPVWVRNAMRNQPPKAAFMSMFILEVDQFIMTPLSTATLDAEDNETPKQRLVFNVTRPPREGFITHLADHTKPISSFTWTDLNDMLIAYQPPNSSHTQRRNYEVEFEAHDSYFEKSVPITVHVSVRTADTNAPRVSWNMGLSLLEGQSRPITWEQLQIVDNDNPKAVRLITVDGLQHGRLTVRGGKGFMFTISDIKAGVVRYHHDDSDTTKDYVVFRITDGIHHTRHKFPISVLPKDDSPPFLITNTVLELAEGQTALLRGSVLQAADADSSDDYILYNVTRPPRAGEIMKMPGPGVTGYPVSRFLQKDLFHSVIYYRHLGNEVFDDSFEVVLSDFHDPPNLSEPQVVVIVINPVPDQPPKEAPGVVRHLVVKETEVIHLTKKELHFIDQESPDLELTYTVTTLPFFTSNYGSQDAGRLFLVDSIPKFTKDPDAPVLRLFTQHAVNFLKVAYMPPILDIGLHPHHIQFVLSVTNQLGTTVTGICFNVTVLPVDNQPPQVLTNSLRVEEGGECWVSEDHLSVSDPDSSEERLRVQVKRPAQHGAIQLNGAPVRTGQAFTLLDLKRLKVRYVHDGSESVRDDVEFIATDGNNTAEFVLDIKVTLVNDEVPVLMPGLRPTLDCAEGQEVVISVENLYATDADSEDERLTYMIARQPYYGVVQRNGLVVDRFSQADVIARLISYRHTGQEIGLTPRYDTITVVISDSEGEAVPACCYETGAQHTPQLTHTLPVYDLNITVFPVDNQAPTISTGDVFVVDEGGSATLKETHLKVADPDTPEGDLEVVILSPPQVGYIENILPSPGFEKSNMGISIGSFQYSDLLQGHINYVQSRHQRMEPTRDQLMVCVTDGHRRSSPTPLYIIINPTNDEAPDFLARNITVSEGQVKELDASIFNAVDLDVPRDRLKFSVVQPPQHGSIVGSYHGNEVARFRRLVQDAGDAGVVMRDFTMEELKNGMTLMYMHDDSESEQDGFDIELSDGKHTLLRHVCVNVLPVNDEEPHIIRNTGVAVEVGESRLISGAVLYAQDKDTPPYDITYVIESIPSHGLLQRKVGSDWVKLSVGMNCTQETVDMNQLRYVHTGPPGKHRQDFFVFHLLDGQNQSPAQHFYIAIKDLAKGDIALMLRPVKASRGERVLLTTDVLLALDGTDQPEELLYALTAPPSDGQLEYVQHPGLPIHSFSQMDIAAQLICYVHDNRATATREWIRFVVSNGKTTRNGTLEISVELTDRILPSLVRNGGLRVPQGSTVTLTPATLSLADPDTPPDLLTFTLRRPPQYGTLLLQGESLVARGNFTQQHLQELGVAYRHGGGASQIDRFTFMASDSTHNGFLLDGRVQTEPVFFTIEIESLDNSAPVVVVQKTLWKAELLKDGRYGIFLSSNELQAQDAHSDDQQLLYYIIRAPYFGYLENSTTGEFVRVLFSQRDLSRRTLLYVIDSAQEALTDSMEFQVADLLGNRSPAHTLVFSWSSVGFAQTEYHSCEDQASVPLALTRKGNVQESSFVTVKVREISAVAGKDFKPPPSSLVQFDPGVSSRSWRVEVMQDQLEEAEEEMEVSLTTPVGTVLNHNTRALLKITDTGGGPVGPEGGLLGGSQVESRPVPKHASIQVETLPLTQGDGAPHSDPSPIRKRLRTSGNGRKIPPSSMHRNGSEVIYTYHGIVSMHVEDDSISQAGRRASVQVTNRGQHSDINTANAPPHTSKASAHTHKDSAHTPKDSAHTPKARANTPKAPGDGADPRKSASASKKDNSSPPQQGPKACTPELMGFLHLNEMTGQLSRCNGVAWKPWAPTDEVVNAQKCPQGWTHHGGHCYLLSDKKETWSSAARACRESFHGNLVSVLSKADMNWLWDFSGRKPFWIGLNDRESRGRWEWVGGEPVSYTNWRRSPPRSREGNRKCVLVWRRSKWHIRDCKKGKGHRYVCYIRT
ncbi:FRAS1-related extracellular matrix protein 1a isoform X3 [Alosa pseudoharengus]|uniref:FRAS1-related extracellular matrix protein 1a isoform X3 n=1 Tax=Alosa pseudoharengus TaxID=34774 RepID=UPI003F8AFD01